MIGAIREVARNGGGVLLFSWTTRRAAYLILTRTVLEAAAAQGLSVLSEHPDLTNPEQPIPLVLQFIVRSDGGDRRAVDERLIAAIVQAEAVPLYAIRPKWSESATKPTTHRQSLAQLQQ